MKKIILLLSLILGGNVQAESTNNNDSDKYKNEQERAKLVSQLLSGLLKKEIKFDFQKATLFVKNPKCQDYQEILSFLQASSMVLQENSIKEKEKGNREYRILALYGLELKYAGQIAMNQAIEMDCDFLKKSGRKI